MDLKRLTSAGLALTLVAAMAPMALAEEAEPTSGLLISPAPTSGMPQVEVAAPNGGYNTVITINGKVLESFDFDREVPGWGSQSVTWKISELDTVSKGYVPMRAVVQADHGNCAWYSGDNQGWFSLGENQIVVQFDDLSVQVNDELVEGVSAELRNGVTYLPVSIFEGLEGYAVVDNSTEEAESYEITTPNGAPIMKLAYELMDIAGLGHGMKSSMEDMETFNGENTGFKAEFVTEGVAFLPMMTSPDTLVMGKFAEGKEKDLEESFEAYRKQQEATFEWYLSHNLPKVENAKFVIEGEWFLFLIAENADEAVEQFKTAVQEMDAQ